MRALYAYKIRRIRGFVYHPDSPYSCTNLEVALLEIHSTPFHCPSNFQPAVHSCTDIGIVRASVALAIQMGPRAAAFTEQPIWSPKPKRHPNPVGWHNPIRQPPLQEDNLLDASWKPGLTYVVRIREAGTEACYPDQEVFPSNLPHFANS